MAQKMEEQTQAEGSEGEMDKGGCCLEGRVVAGGEYIGRSEVSASVQREFPKSGRGGGMLDVRVQTRGQRRAGWRGGRRRRRRQRGRATER
jgi:hypothetical protein